MNLFDDLRVDIQCLIDDHTDEPEGKFPILDSKKFEEDLVKLLVPHVELLPHANDAVRLAACAMSDDVDLFNVDDILFALEEEGLFG